MFLWKVPVVQRILQIYNPWEMIQNEFIFVFNCLLKMYSERLAFLPLQLDYFLSDSYIMGILSLKTHFQFRKYPCSAQDINQLFILHSKERPLHSLYQLSLETWFGRWPSLGEGTLFSLLSSAQANWLLFRYHQAWGVGGKKRSIDSIEKCFLCWYLVSSQVLYSAWQRFKMNVFYIHAYSYFPGLHAGLL